MSCKGGDGDLGMSSGRRGWAGAPWALRWIWTPVNMSNVVVLLSSNKRSHHSCRTSKDSATSEPVPPTIWWNEPCFLSFIKAWKGPKSSSSRDNRAFYDCLLLMVNLAFAVALNYPEAEQLFIWDGGWGRTDADSIMRFILTAYAFHVGKISRYTATILFHLLKLLW